MPAFFLVLARKLNLKKKKVLPEINHELSHINDTNNQFYFKGTCPWLSETMPMDILILIFFFIPALLSIRVNFQYICSEETR